MDMRLKILMRKNGISDDADVRLAQTYTEWVVGKILSPVRVDRLDLKIALRSQRIVGTNTMGRCLNLMPFKPMPFAFRVTIARNYSSYWKRRVLAHELVHVKQYSLGELVDKRDAVSGKIHTYWKGVDCTGMEYKDYPWEIEAEAMERELADEYQGLIGRKVA